MGELLPKSKYKHNGRSEHINEVGKELFTDCTTRHYPNDTFSFFNPNGELSALEAQNNVLQKRACKDGAHPRESPRETSIPSRATPFVEMLVTNIQSL